MNERIKELAEQAGAIIFGGKQCIFGDEDMEKFAELIIQECLKLLITDEGNDNTSDAIWSLEELGVDVGKLLDQIRS